MGVLVRKRRLAQQFHVGAIGRNSQDQNVPSALRQQRRHRFHSSIRYGPARPRNQSSSALQERRFAPSRPNKMEGRVLPLASWKFVPFKSFLKRLNLHSSHVYISTEQCNPPVKDFFKK